MPASIAWNVQNRVVRLEGHDAPPAELRQVALRVDLRALRRARSRRPRAQSSICRPVESTSASRITQSLAAATASRGASDLVERREVVRAQRASRRRAGPRRTRRRERSSPGSSAAGASPASTPSASAKTAYAGTTMPSMSNARRARSGPRARRRGRSHHCAITASGGAARAAVATDEQQHLDEQPAPPRDALRPCEAVRPVLELARQKRRADEEPGERAARRSGSAATVRRGRELRLRSG